jgi:mannitol 2-dehydrogenase
MAAARHQHGEPLAFIANREVFGDLIDDDRFVSIYQSMPNSLHTKGARVTFEALI